ncbi:MAG: NADP oxidoreductase, partial [Rhodothermales bacterium]
SVGYRGVPLPGVPFHERWGVILNENGRVIDPETQQPVTGLYVAGWIKRGPTGVIGTNKADALDTVKGMLEDVAGGLHFLPATPEADAAERLVRVCQPDYFSYADWQRIDEQEIAKGQAQGRPRVKFIYAEEMLAALGRT